MIRRFLGRCYHACWYVVAALILTAAVTVTLVRLALPQISSFHDSIQVWVSDQVGYPVRLGRISAEWQGWTPYVYLHDIEVLNERDGQILTRLESADLSLNPFFTLIQQRLSPLRITITGPELLIVRNENGAFSIAQGTDFNMQQLDNAGVFTDWVLQQRSISIKNAKVHYMDMIRHVEPLALKDVSLSFRRAWRHIQIDISARLPAEYGESLNLAMDAHGDITTPDWSGQIYFHGKNILPGNIYNLYPQPEAQVIISSAPANISIWSHWQASTLAKLSSHITVSDLDLNYAGTIHRINKLDTLLTLIREQDQNIKVRLGIQELITGNGAWPQTVVDLYRHPTTEQGANYTARFEHLRIEDILPALTSVYPDIGNALGTNHRLEGIAHNVELHIDPARPEQMTFALDLENLNILDTVNGSSISNLAGQVRGDGQHGWIRLDSAYTQIKLPDVFAEALELYELAGDIEWQLHNGQFKFNTTAIETHTPDFNALLAGTISTSADSGIYTNLFFNASGFKLEQIHRYMPLDIPDDVRDWVKQGLFAGEVPSLDMTLRGDLADFPFNNNEGQFKLIASIQDATMDYHPEWTPVDQLNAELIIDNNQLTINAHSGLIYNARITEAVAHIDQLDADKTSIVINGHVKGTTEDALFIINNSPLSKTGLLSGISQHDLSGNVTLDLGLDVPFHEKETTVNGDLSFDQATLDAKSYGIELTNINGSLLFTRHTVSTKNLFADYSGLPVKLDINMDAESRLSLGLSGDADGDYIAGQLIRFFPQLGTNITLLKERLRGTCSWTARMIPDPAQPAGDVRLLNITSDLSGLAIDLPAPLGKTSEAMPLSITSGVSGNADERIHITLGDHIKLNQSTSTAPARTELVLGKDTQFINDGEGLLIHGTLEHLPLSEWQDFIDSFNLNTAENPGRKILVDLQADNLGYYGQNLTNAQFNLNNLNTDWQIGINSNEVDGTVQITDHASAKSVKASFSRLHLQSDEDEDHDFNIDPRQQLPLELVAEHFTYGEMDLGKLTLQTTRINSGVSIENLHFEKPGIAIDGKGTWQITDDVEISSFDFSLDADQLETMLTTFDYNVVPIRDGPTKIALTASWPGSPMDFSLSGVNGDLDMKIGKGQFLEIEPAAGRLFGLLSLQTLPRRLSLDFSDLFSKGLSFDSIEGSFIIEAGNAYTNNLSMIGPSANVDVTGRTGLIDKDYDQIVTVTPQVSDSVPLVSALFGPVGIGVGAIFYLAGELFDMIPNEIDKLLRYHYTITGKWEDPVVEKYKFSSDSSG